MEKSVHILFSTKYTVVKGEERGCIHLKSVSPAINKNLKFGIVGKEKHFSFEQLREKISKLYFKRGDILYLFIINQKTGERQNFGINISKKWPKGLAADKIVIRPASVEITEYLENIGVLD